MRLILIAAVLVIGAALGATADQEQPKPALPALGPDPTVTPTVADTAASVGHVGWPVVWCIVVGIVAGFAFSVLAGTGAAEYPQWRWPIWGALAAAFTVPWLVAAEFIPWFTAFTGWAVMVGTALVIDVLWGGRSIPAQQTRKETRIVADESWRDVIPPSAVIRGRIDRAGQRVPTWRDWEQMSWQVRDGVSVVSLAQSWGMSPDEIAHGIRDFRLAEDRWEDAINGAPAPTGGVAAGRDLVEEIRDTGWDAFLAATPMRLIDRAPEPGYETAAARGDRVPSIRLLEITAGSWAGERVLEVEDASVEDGFNQRVGIPVGRTHTNARAALADTWGLAPGDYQPARHT